MKQYRRVSAGGGYNCRFHKMQYFSCFFAFIRMRTKKRRFSLTKPGTCHFGQIGANHPSSGRSKRRFKIAFTVCGLAFPPVAFIT